jgi:hypothetical protein
MKIREVAIELTRREAKLKQVNIAQMSEIVAVLSDLVYSQPEVIAALILNGKRRRKK